MKSFDYHILIVHPVLENNKININKGNIRIPLFETHKSIEKNKSGLRTKTEGNALNIRGEQRHNIKMVHTQKRTKH